MPPGGYSQSYDFLPEFHDKYDQNDDCVNRMYRQYTHTHTFTYTHICAQISYKRHFFRSSANEEICHLEAIRRAMIFGHCYLAGYG